MMKGIDRPENAHVIVGLLRSLHAADPQAANALFAYRAPCNQALVDHPRIIVRGFDEDGDGEGPDVGFLGVINALFGPTHRVATVVDDVTGELTDDAFRVVDVSKSWEAAHR